MKVGALSFARGVHVEVLVVGEVVEGLRVVVEDGLLAEGVRYQVVEVLPALYHHHLHVLVLEDLEGETDFTETFLDDVRAVGVRRQGGARRDLLRIGSGYDEVRIRAETRIELWVFG